MEAYQKILFPYAYNILGAVEDARDAVQEVMSNHFAVNKEGIENEKNYLIKSVINHAINTKNRNKRIARQSDVWLPEPVATDDEADKNLHLKDILSYSLMLLLEKLNATERAVFILKESFDYSHQEIAEVLSVTEEHSRKLLSRSKAKLFKPAAASRTIEQNAHAAVLLENYIEAIRKRDTQKLESMLSQDIAFYADGGGKVSLVKEICLGAVDTAELVTMIYHRYQTTFNIVFKWINHQPAFLYYKNDKLYVCQVFNISFADSKILQINTILDPDKLKGLEGMLNIEA
ncbi:RNA polymerase sigma-70 factor, ECF subfamily [Chitinophaga sp. CF118]|uniref:sigma-70 family RNA polymerase sigma factor n=1 Tax=Chitinophaga sp. CF118 TaxID=1884367 RepID=UPI0008F19F06|nr:sigma-70 family RNA polymerase sigma factor [Chitinophaga sp. CF118]SFE02240.1 RNA polymerase sigma-70 factor, ECF subfamily [Chitinophaga sp. CF118]